jgi:hypothetical protein
MTAPKPGDRIRLVAMLDDADPIPTGTTGTVTAVIAEAGGSQAGQREAGADAAGDGAGA